MNWFVAWSGVRSRLAGFLCNQAGGVAVIFGLSLPVIAVLTCGAVDLAAVSADRNTLQDTADSAALAAAKQMGVAADPSAVGQRAQAYVASQLSRLSAQVRYSVATTVAADRSNVKVEIAATRTSFFGNLLPPGGWKMGASATAKPMGQRPLCVLATGTAANTGITLAGNSLLTAPKCLIHSNSDVSAGDAAWLQAAAVQSVGAASGHITPAPLTDAPAISDPFAGMDMNALLPLCSPLDLVFSVGVNLLAPGVHCGNLSVAKGATVILLPGEHYFLKGKLNLSQNSVLSGTNVVMVFDDKSSFQFQDGAQVRLQGRSTGRFAGFVVATTRTNVGTFEISSDGARELLGTIYVPSATLQILGTQNQVADQSAWTVIVAQRLLMSGSANLVINADYAGSSVPVPGGVGPVPDKVVLTH
jgi:Flp pilus assembly protein TadG